MHHAMFDRAFYRLHGLHFAAGSGTFVFARLFGRIGFSRFPLDPVHSSRNCSVLHARAGCVSRTAGPCAAVRRSHFCPVFAGDWVGVARRARRVHRTPGNGSLLKLSFNPLIKAPFTLCVVLLVHCRVRPVPSGRRTEGVWCWSVIFIWRIGILLE